VADLTSYSRDWLEKEYDPTIILPTGAFPAYLEAYAELSARSRDQCEWRTEKYGTGEEDTVDVFPALQSGAPLLVFLHGGYWHLLGKDNSSFAAAGLVASGAAVAVLNYSLAPRVRVHEIYEQCSAAVAWLRARARRVNADPTRVYLCGHSAGAHLAALIMIDAPTGRQQGAGNVAGGFLISGIYDLEPIRRLRLNKLLRLDRCEVEAISPLRRQERPQVPRVIAVGARESSEFRRQSAMLHTYWGEKNPELGSALIAPDRNHFDVVLDLGDQRTQLGAAACALMELP
jgi:arylformamidase